MSGESNTGNNCSSPVQVTVRPDLTVRSSVSETTLTSGDSFVLTATVRNGGTIASAATTLHFYRSVDRGISTADTEVGSDAVGALAPSETSSKMVSLTAPATSGTYYYGACVDSVSGGEISTGNNCSTAVVVFGGGPFPAYDLTISRTVLHAPSIVVLGTTITMTVDVTNSGPNASRPARLRFGNTVYRAIPVLDPNETVTYERQDVRASDGRFRNIGNNHIQGLHHRGPRRGEYGQQLCFPVSNLHVGLSRRDAAGSWSFRAG